MTPSRQPLSAFHALHGVRGHTSIVCLSLPLWILYSITWTELSAKPADSTVIQGEPNILGYVPVFTKPTVAPTLNPRRMTFQTYEYKNTKAPDPRMNLLLYLKMMEKRALPQTQLAYSDNWVEDSSIHGCAALSKLIFLEEYIIHALNQINRLTFVRASECEFRSPLSAV